MKILNRGLKMGLCLFLVQAVSLKMLDELFKNDLLGRGWHIGLTSAVLIFGLQTVQYAYNRGLSDAQQCDHTKPTDLG